MTMYQQLQEVWDELTAPGGQFAVGHVAVNGIDVKAYVQAPPSLREVWLGSAAFAERDYLVFQNERISYGEAHRQVASVANWLLDQGVGRGDRVAIAMRNYPEWLLAYWAGVSVGAAVVGVNAWWAGPELVYGLNDSQPKVLICDEERFQRFLAHRSEIEAPLVPVGVRVSGERADLVPWSEVTAFGGDLPPVDVAPEDTACIFYTSGTTGHPKGAELNHRGCVTNIMNIAFWGACTRTLAERNGLPVPPEDIALAALVTTPLFHVTANNCVAHTMTAQGGKLVHMYRWDPEEALQLIERENITSASGVPVMARELISHRSFDRYDTSSLLTLGGGGAQLQPDLVSKIDAALPNARPNTGYGMTETSGIVTSISADFFVDKPQSVGRAMPTFDVKCVDEDGQEVAPGQPGELWVKGACVINGYINRPKATAETITEGWLHTGDIARIDADGFLYIVDRAKDMVLRGGENVYCAEVESAIHDHPNVLECAVFGVPDDRLGEEVGAAVVCHEGTTIDADALRTHCAARIAKHKVPRYVWFLDQPLPRNANGKFLKKELRERLRPDAGQADA